MVKSEMLYSIYLGGVVGKGHNHEAFDDRLEDR